MKKLFVLVSVIALLFVVSCKPSVKNTSTSDSTKVAADSTVVLDSAKVVK